VQGDQAGLREGEVVGGRNGEGVWGEAWGREWVDDPRQVEDIHG
jgi:hypothetical protein